MDIFEQNLLILIVECAIFCAIFTIGVFLQVKVIIVLKRDQAMAWEINFLHSVVMIVHYSFVSIVNAVDYIQIAFYHHQLFHHFTIFRYLVFSVMCFGMSEMWSHSLYIAMYKYIFIIQRETVSRIGEHRTKTLLLWTYVTGLFAWTLAYIVRPNFGPLHHFGLQNTVGGSISSGDPNITSMYSTIDSFTRQLVSCGLNDLDHENVGNIVINIVTKVTCTGQALLSYAVVLNVFEIFFYIRIFDHMSR